MATMKQMREGLAANLRAGLTGVQVSEYVQANPTPPTVHVVPSSVDYHQTYGNGLEVYRFVVQAFIAATLDDVAQLKLDEFIDSAAVRTALEADDTLGGRVGTLIVTGMSGYNRVVIEGREMFSADFEVMVYA